MRTTRTWTWETFAEERSPRNEMECSEAIPPFAVVAGLLPVACGGPLQDGEYAGEPIAVFDGVIDQPSGRDITSAVLLQIIGDMEVSGQSVLTSDLLCDLLRTVARAEPETPERLRAALKAAAGLQSAPPYSSEKTVSAMTPAPLSGTGCPT